MPPLIRPIVALCAWPTLLSLCIVATALGFRLGHPDLAFILTYAALMVSLLLLERWMPHEEQWLARDGQLFADIAHSALSSAVVQGLLGFTASVALSMGVTSLKGEDYGIWPTDWPLPIQIVAGLILLEFPLYWGHRLAHEWKALWLFHAVHHSVERLSVINNGRFHSVDAVKSVLPGIIFLLALGAPLEVMTWLSALGAYIGMMTHSNVVMRFGFLSWLFNTPELHRWHHSKDLREGNRNYGESLMIWDWVFGSWFNQDRRPPRDIGVKEAMPRQFARQLIWPFLQLAATGQRQFGWRRS